MYISTYIYPRKLPPIFLWVSKCEVKLSMGENNFQHYPIYVSFKYLVPNVLFSFCFQSSSAFFLKIWKTLFPFQNWILKFSFETYIHSVILKIILALINFLQIGIVSLRGSWQIYTTMSKGSSIRIGWMDGRDINSVLQFSCYFVRI